MQTHFVQALYVAPCGSDAEGTKWSADVPLHDEQGNCYWLDETGQKLDHDPNVSAKT